MFSLLSSSFIQLFNYILRTELLCFKSPDQAFISILINPLKAGGSESMYSLEERPLENRVEMHVHSPIFHGQLKENKIER